MKINRINGIVHCPFCGQEYPTIRYSCNTSGREWGTIDEHGNEEMEDSETSDSYDYDYNMDCCDTSIEYRNIRNIYAGNFGVIEDIEDDYDWEDDEEDDEEEEEIDPKQLLLNKIIC